MLVYLLIEYFNRFSTLRKEKFPIPKIGHNINSLMLQQIYQMEDIKAIIMENNFMSLILILQLRELKIMELRNFYLLQVIFMMQKILTIYLQNQMIFIVPLAFILAELKNLIMVFLKMQVIRLKKNHQDILNSVEHKHKFVAIGECGLDYDRFEYADKETQLLVFPHHFDLAQKYNLPMYLHSRSTNGDFPRIVKENRHKFTTGIVHSYTGDVDEMKQLVEMGLYIGINGCSLKTEENLEVVKQIPLDRIMLETDCPYCDIRNSHASAKYLKTTFPKVAKEKYSKDKLLRDRNEPCAIVQVCEVVAALLGKTEEEVSQIAWENTLKMFNLKE